MGFYNSPAELRGAADPDFHGWGRCPTDMETGLCSFETIKPGRVPFSDGRLMAPHISLWIVARGINIGLHTRLYFSDEAEGQCRGPDPGAHRAPLRVPTLIAERQGRQLHLRRPSAGREGNGLLRQLTGRNRHDRIALRPSAAVRPSRRRGGGAAFFRRSGNRRHARLRARAGGSGGRKRRSSRKDAAAAIVAGSGRHSGRTRRSCAPASPGTASSCPNWCASCKAAVGEPHGAAVHFGATSQDVIDTGADASAEAGRRASRPAVDRKHRAA